MTRKRRQQKQQVLFARINRRAEQSLNRRAFNDEMAALARSHDTRAERDDHIWIAADLELTDDNLLVGIIGYETTDTYLNFNEDEWSWIKGAQNVAEGASDRTLSPFAVDLTANGRWICFGPSGYLNQRTFPTGFAVVMNEALRRQGDAFADWEVDILSDTSALVEWIDSHTDITKMVVSIRRPNPGRDLTSDLEEMRRLRARTKEETFSPYYGESLRIEGEELEDLRSDVEKTNVDLRLTARVGSATARFNSKNNIAQDFVDRYGDDMRAGMDAVTEVLRAFKRRRAQDTAHLIDNGSSDEPSSG